MSAAAPDDPGSDDKNSRADLSKLPLRGPGRRGKGKKQAKAEAAPAPPTQEVSPPPAAVPPAAAPPAADMFFQKGDASANSFRPFYWTYERNDDAAKTPEAEPAPAAITPPQEVELPRRRSRRRKGRETAEPPPPSSASEPSPPELPPAQPEPAAAQPSRRQAARSVIHDLPARPRDAAPEEAPAATPTPQTPPAAEEPSDAPRRAARSLSRELRTRARGVEEPPQEAPPDLPIPDASAAAPETQAEAVPQSDFAEQPPETPPLPPVPSGPSRMASARSVIRELRARARSEAEAQAEPSSGDADSDPLPTAADTEAAAGPVVADAEPIIEEVPAATEPEAESQPAETMALPAEAPEPAEAPPISRARAAIRALRARAKSEAEAKAEPPSAGDAEGDPQRVAEDAATEPAIVEASPSAEAPAADSPAETTALPAGAPKPVDVAASRARAAIRELRARARQKADAASDETAGRPAEPPATDGSTAPLESRGPDALKPSVSADEDLDPALVVGAPPKTPAPPVSEQTPPPAAPEVPTPIVSESQRGARSVIQELRARARSPSSAEAEPPAPPAIIDPAHAASAEPEASAPPAPAVADPLPISTSQKAARSVIQELRSRSKGKSGDDDREIRAPAASTVAPPAALAPAPTEKPPLARPRKVAASDGKRDGARTDGSESRARSVIQEVRARAKTESEPKQGGLGAFFGRLFGKASKRQETKQRKPETSSPPPSAAEPVHAAAPLLELSQRAAAAESQTPPAPAAPDDRLGSVIARLHAIKQREAAGASPEPTVEMAPLAIEALKPTTPSPAKRVAEPEVAAGEMVGDRAPQEIPRGAFAEAAAGEPAAPMAEPLAEDPTALTAAEPAPIAVDLAESEVEAEVAAAEFAADDQVVPPVDSAPPEAGAEGRVPDHGIADSAASGPAPVDAAGSFAETECAQPAPIVEHHDLADALPEAAPSDAATSLPDDASGEAMLGEADAASAAFAGEHETLASSEPELAPEDLASEVIAAEPLPEYPAEIPVDDSAEVAASKAEAAAAPFMSEDNLVVPVEPDPAASAAGVVSDAPVADPLLEVPVDAGSDVVPDDEEAATALMSVDDLVVPAEPEAPGAGFAGEVVSELPAEFDAHDEAVASETQIPNDEFAAEHDLAASLEPQSEAAEFASSVVAEEVVSELPGEMPGEAPASEMGGPAAAFDVATAEETAAELSPIALSQELDSGPLGEISLHPIDEVLASDADASAAGHDVAAGPVAAEVAPEIVSEEPSAEPPADADGDRGASETEIAAEEVAAEHDIAGPIELEPAAAEPVAELPAEISPDTAIDTGFAEPVTEAEVFAPAEPQPVADAYAAEVVAEELVADLLAARPDEVDGRAAARAADIGAYFNGDQDIVVPEPELGAVALAPQADAEELVSVLPTDVFGEPPADILRDGNGEAPGPDPATVAFATEEDVIAPIEPQHAAVEQLLPEPPAEISVDIDGDAMAGEAEVPSAEFAPEVSDPLAEAPGDAVGATTADEGAPSATEITDQVLERVSELVAEMPDDPIGEGKAAAAPLADVPDEAIGYIEPLAAATASEEEPTTAIADAETRPELRDEAVAPLDIGEPLRATEGAASRDESVAAASPEETLASAFGGLLFGETSVGEEPSETAADPEPTPAAAEPRLAAAEWEMSGEGAGEETQSDSARCEEVGGVEPKTAVENLDVVATETAALVEAFEAGSDMPALEPAASLGPRALETTAPFGAADAENAVMPEARAALASDAPTTESAASEAGPVVPSMFARLRAFAQSTRQRGETTKEAPFVGASEPAAPADTAAAPILAESISPAREVVMEERDAAPEPFPEPQASVTSAEGVAPTEATSAPLAPPPPPSSAPERAPVPALRAAVPSGIATPAAPIETAPAAPMPDAAAIESAAAAARTLLEAALLRVQSARHRRERIEPELAGEAAPSPPPSLGAGLRQEDAERRGPEAAGPGASLLDSVPMAAFVPRTGAQSPEDIANAAAAARALLETALDVASARPTLSLSPAHVPSAIAGDAEAVPSRWETPAGQGSLPLEARPADAPTVPAAHPADWSRVAAVAPPGAALPSQEAAETPSRLIADIGTAEIAAALFAEDATLPDTLTPDRAPPPPRQPALVASPSPPAQPMLDAPSPAIPAAYGNGTRQPPPSVTPDVTPPMVTMPFAAEAPPAPALVVPASPAADFWSHAAKSDHRRVAAGGEFPGEAGERLAPPLEAPAVASDTTLPQVSLPVMNEGGEHHGFGAFAATSDLSPPFPPAQGDAWKGLGHKSEAPVPAALGEGFAPAVPAAAELRAAPLPAELDERFAALPSAFPDIKSVAPVSFGQNVPNAPTAARDATVLNAADGRFAPPPASSATEGVAPAFFWPGVADASDDARDMPLAVEPDARLAPSPAAAETVAPASVLSALDDLRDEPVPPEVDERLAPSPAETVVPISFRAGVPQAFDDVRESPLAAAPDERFAPPLVPADTESVAPLSFEQSVPNAVEDMREEPLPPEGDERLTPSSNETVAPIFFRSDVPKALDDVREAPLAAAPDERFAAPPPSTDRESVAPVSFGDSVANALDDIREVPLAAAPDERFAAPPPSTDRESVAPVSFGHSVANALDDIREAPLAAAPDERFAALPPVATETVAAASAPSALGDIREEPLPPQVDERVTPAPDETVVPISFRSGVASALDDVRAPPPAEEETVALPSSSRGVPNALDDIREPLFDTAGAAAAPTEFPALRSPVLSALDDIREAEPDPSFASDNNVIAAEAEFARRRAFDDTAEELDALPPQEGEKDTDVLGEAIESVLASKWYGNGEAPGTPTTQRGPSPAPPAARQVTHDSLLAELYSARQADAPPPEPEPERRGNRMLVIVCVVISLLAVAGGAVVMSGAGKFLGVSIGAPRR